MKITGGTARGVPLFEGHGLPIRPAQAIVRQSLFNILGGVEGSVVLDLFSGTGSLGCEALSRGAARCVFLDRDPRCVALIRKNLAKLRFEDRSDVLGGDIFQSVPDLANVSLVFDLVFVAPPYEFFRRPEIQSRLSRWMSELASTSLLAKSVTVIVEHPVKKGFDPAPEGMRATDTRAYGQTALTFYGKI